MSTVNWLGVYPALLTPFKNDDTIDFEMFEKNLFVQIEAGIDGAVLGGSLGEASTLTKDEVRSLLTCAKEVAGEKIPVIVNIAEQVTSEAIKVALDFEKNGADGLMLLPPLRYKADGHETVEYFKAIARSTALPIMIYNNPHDYKIEVTIAMFEELSAVSNIRAVKESTRDVSNVTRMINRFEDRFKILCGVDTLALEAMALGAHGWIAGLANAFPAETVAVYRLMKANHYRQALTIYRWFLPLLELDLHPKLVQYIKLAATKTGIGSEYVRAPRLMLQGFEREDISEIIDRGINTRPELPDYLQLQALENVERAALDII